MTLELAICPRCKQQAVGIEYETGTIRMAYVVRSLSSAQTSMEIQKDKIRPRPTVLVVCKMCARPWSPFEDKCVCDWSYVGTHRWGRYPSDNELKMWAYAVGDDATE